MIRMKHLLSFAGMQLISISSYAQRMIDPLLPPPPIEAVEDVILIDPEQMPEFEGGEVGLRSFIAKNIRYPETAAESNIEGTVYVQYLVLKDGTINNIKLLRGVIGAPDLDKEALRVVKLTNGKWKPGMQNGKPVNVRMNIPIRFKLQ
jgi:periplasmic protein TonB